MPADTILKYNIVEKPLCGWEHSRNWTLQRAEVNRVVQRPHTFVVLSRAVNSVRYTEIYRSPPEPFQEWFAKVPKHQLGRDCVVRSVPWRIALL